MGPSGILCSKETMSDSLRQKYLDQSEQHQRVRSILRVVGPVILATGILCLIIAFINIVSSVGSFGIPKLFWLPFVGIPLIFIGLVMTGHGFQGAIARYHANELAPVAKDTVNYVGEGTQDGLRSVGTALGQGLTAGMQSTEGATQADVIYCPACNTTNDQDARFCDACGQSLPAATTCSACGENNDADARFCDHCGSKL